MTTEPLVYDLPVDVLWIDNRVIHCRSESIEADTITVKCPYNANVGTELKLAFKLLIGFTPLLITGIGVVKMSYLAGEDDLFHLRLQFKDLPGQSKKAVESFIHQHKSH